MKVYNYNNNMDHLNSYLSCSTSFESHVTGEVRTCAPGYSAGQGCGTDNRVDILQYVVQLLVLRVRTCDMLPHAYPCSRRDLFIVGPELGNKYEACSCFGRLHAV